MHTFWISAKLSALPLTVSFWTKCPAFRQIRNQMGEQLADWLGSNDYNQIGRQSSVGLLRAPF